MEIDEKKTNESVFSGYFATLKSGKVVTICEAFPPQELVSCQIELTKQEYYLLKAIDSKLEETQELIKAVQAKIIANGS